MILVKMKFKKSQLPENILGVYYFLDENNDILYIGKSINIKKLIYDHILHLVNIYKKEIFHLKK